MDPRTAYREAAARGASPVQLVIRLYEQVIDDLRQAANALDRQQVDLRTRKINHAILVIGHLQSTLDFANGGEAARDLNVFYDTLRQNLVRAQFAASKPMLTQQITDLLHVRSAWLVVEGSGNPGYAASAEGASGRLPAPTRTPSKV